LSLKKDVKKAEKSSVFNLVMLPKKNRVDTKEVDLIFKKGRSLSSVNLSLKYLKNNSQEVKISLIAPKNIAKSAVKRNLLRRCGYTALGKYFNQFPLGFIGVLVFKKYQDNILILEDEIKSILHKIN